MSDRLAPITDESEADDGAAHLFWRFILIRRMRGEREFDLEDLVELREAIREFEEEGP